MHILFTPVLSDCGYLHDYSESDVIQGMAIRLGYFPSKAILDRQEHYVRKWYKDKELLSLTYRYLEISANTYNNEYALTLSDVDSFSSGNYSVRCTENRTEGDKFTNTVQISVIGKCSNLDLKIPIRAKELKFFIVRNVRSSIWYQHIAQLINTYNLKH